MIKLSDHFDYKRLIRFVTPCVLMMLFMSVYGVIDGLFVSNFAGKTPFAAVNLIYPFSMILGSVGFMVGSGGTAVVSNALGEGKAKEANKYFSFLVFFTLVTGVIISVAGIFAVPKVCRLFKAEGELFDDAVLYGKIIVGGTVFLMLQNVFMSFCTTAEKPRLGFWSTFAAGVTNIAFDGIFVAGLSMGVMGAAIATVMSQVVGGLLPFVYFALKNTSLLRLCKCGFYGKVLGKTCFNGSSEFVNNISGSLVSMVYNAELMKLAGENGIAAYGVLMYVNFIYFALFLGYSIGVSPLVGYNHGAENTAELKNIFKKSIVIMSVAGVLMTGLAEGLARPLSLLFVGYDGELCDMTAHAFYLMTPFFAVAGVNVFCSALFTALGNGIISALSSFLRTLVFQIAAVLVMPMLMGISGVWLSAVVAEVLTLVLSVAFFLCFRKKYMYA